MARERKSPQQKKQLEYIQDHFTPGWQSSRMFPKTWRRKKARVNREFRRKSDELLAQAKVGIASDDVDSVADDLTAGRFQKSVSRKRLRKVGTVTVGEKVKRKLEKRRDAVGRNARRHQQCDRAAADAVHTLAGLSEDALVTVAHRADLLSNGRNVDELKRVLRSKAPIDRALHFLYLVSCGSVYETDALRRNPELCRTFEIWSAKAGRILAREQRAMERKLEEKQHAKKKLKKWSKS